VPALQTAPEFDPSKAIEAVKYEYDMALVTARLLTATSKPVTVTHYAILESFLVHVRNLHDFFMPRTDDDLSKRRNPNSLKHSDIWATDFAPGFGRRTLNREVVSTINHFLQHLTTWRQLDNPGWDPALLTQVYASMSAFLDVLDDTYRKRLLQTHRSVGALLDSWQA
jgi:hypothetical protein